jgi:hypothetical protein
MLQLRPGRRPEPTDPRAKLVLEWAEVVFYILGQALTATVLVVALIEYGPSALSLLKG